MSITREHEFISFDGGVKARGRLFLPEDRSDLSVHADQLKEQGSLISRGAGLSFSASSFDSDVTSIFVTRMNRIEVLEPGAGTVTIEAGVPVGALLNFLTSHNFYIPVLPGYPTITVGGCMAADVHGKNQARDGSFIGQVESFLLHHVDHGEIKVSRETNSELFDLTLGGGGLTGTILSVTLKVSTLPDRNLNVETEPVEDIFKLPSLLEQRSQSAEFLVSWHDFNQTGARFGQGFVQSGSFAKNSILGTANVASIFPIRMEEMPESSWTLTAETRGAKLPAFLRGFVATGAMNSIYSSLLKNKCGPPQQLSVEQCFFPSKTLRDLYFHAFGRRGLFEHQVIVSKERFPDYIERVRWWLSRNALPISIASSKFFKGEAKYLRFNGNGICFALDFPRCAAADVFLRYLDEVSVELNAVPNIFKDSRVPRKVVEACYPQHAEFKTRLVRFDPKRRYQSELSRRLGL